MKTFYVLCGIALGVWLAILAFLLGFLSQAHAQTTVSLTILCTNENWLHSPDCQAKPVLETMVINPYGVSSGGLVNGKKWTQTRITPTLMRFQMEEVDYLTDGKVIIYL